jgi:hypothetical protein
MSRDSKTAIISSREELSKNGHQITADLALYPCRRRIRKRRHGRHFKFCFSIAADVYIKHFRALGDLRT